MVNLSAVLMKVIRQADPQCSVLDRKALYRSYTSMRELIKLLPDVPDEDLIPQLFVRSRSLAGFILLSHASSPRNWRRY